MSKFGLIGKKPKYSYSKTIHESFNKYGYDILEVEKNNLLSVILKEEYCGFNVTTPYKTEVFRYLDDVDDIAKRTGSVNTVKKQDGKLIGFNTDYYGLKYLLQENGVNVNGKTVAVLGNGGVSKTVTLLIKDLNGKTLSYSRRSENGYNDLSMLKNAEIIINTNEIGYPNKKLSNKIVKASGKAEYVIDLNYNPLYSPLLTAFFGKAKVINGLDMLIYQAIKSAEIFTNAVIKASVTEIKSKILKENANVTLIGLAGVGKTSIGKALSKKLGLEFFDTDEEFYKKFGILPKDCILKFGEKEFRKKESQIVKSAPKGKCVIATGGGAVLYKRNREILKSNSVVVYVKRDLDKIDTFNRPLYLKSAPKDLLKNRKKYYEKTCDFEIENTSIEKSVNEIINKI